MTEKETTELCYLHPCKSLLEAKERNRNDSEMISTLKQATTDLRDKISQRESDLKTGLEKCLEDLKKCREDSLAFTTSSKEEVSILEETISRMEVENETRRKELTELRKPDRPPYY